MSKTEENISLKTSLFTRVRTSAWIKISKPFKHQTMIYPFLLGTSLAWHEIKSLNWLVFFISLIAVILMVESSYVSNDCHDYETDKKNASKITGGSKVLVDGSLSMQQARKLAIVSFMLALPLGLILQLYFKTGNWTIPLGLTGMFLAYSYSGHPLRLSYRGLGEISLAINNSFTPIFAGYYLQTHYMSWLPLIVSLPYMVGVLSQKLIREFPDTEADNAVQRRNLVVIFGREKIAIIYNFLILLMILLYIPFLFLEINRLCLILLAIPAFLFMKNFLAIRKGAWKSEEGMRFLNANGFLAMFLIPVSMIGIFLIGGV